MYLAYGLTKPNKVRRQSPSRNAQFRGLAPNKLNAGRYWLLLLSEDEHAEKDQPGEAHGVPEPRHGVHGELAGFNSLETC